MGPTSQLQLGNRLRRPTQRIRKGVLGLEFPEGEELDPGPMSPRQIGELKRKLGQPPVPPTCREYQNSESSSAQPEFCIPPQKLRRRHPIHQKSRTFKRDDSLAKFCSPLPGLVSRSRVLSIKDRRYFLIDQRAKPRSSNSRRRHIGRSWKQRNRKIKCGNTN